MARLDGRRTFLGSCPANNPAAKQVRPVASARRKLSDPGRNHSRSASHLPQSQPRPCTSATNWGCSSTIATSPRSLPRQGSTGRSPRPARPRDPAAVRGRLDRPPGRRCRERTRIDWTYLLGLDLVDPGFHPTVLSELKATSPRSRGRATPLRRRAGACPAARAPLLGGGSEPIPRTCSGRGAPWPGSRP